MRRARSVVKTRSSSTRRSGSAFASGSCANRRTPSAACARRSHRPRSITRNRGGITPSLLSTSRTARANASRVTHGRAASRGGCAAHDRSKNRPGGVVCRDSWTLQLLRSELAADDSRSTAEALRRMLGTDPARRSRCSIDRADRACCRGDSQRLERIRNAAPRWQASLPTGPQDAALFSPAAPLPSRLKTTHVLTAVRVGVFFSPRAVDGAGLGLGY